MPTAIHAAREAGVTSPRTSKTKRTGLAGKANLAAFAITMAILATTNLPVVRATAENPVEFRPAKSFSRSEIPVVPAPETQTEVLPPIPDDEWLTAAALPPLADEFTASISPPKPPKRIRTKHLPFGLFGSLEFRSNATNGSAVWRAALARIDDERALHEFCDAGALHCPPNYSEWRRLLKSVDRLSPRKQLRRLNRDINAMVSHRNDDETFAASDHWASPMQFLQSGGDCEDYTILKYYSLLKLGYRDEHLRIVVVKDAKRRVDHAVLAVRVGKRTYILDNLSDKPVLHSRIRHYKPIYSVNRKQQWVHVATRQISRLFAKRNKSKN